MMGLCRNDLATARNRLADVYGASHELGNAIDVVLTAVLAEG